MTGWFLGVPGGWPTSPIVIIVARRVIGGVSPVMKLNARNATRRHINECFEGENKGEENDKGEELRANADATGRYPQPWLWPIGAMALHPPGKDGGSRGGSILTWLDTDVARY